MWPNRLSSISAPLSVNLELTDKCNLSCGFCYNAAPAYEQMMRTQETNDRANKGPGDILMHIRKQRMFRTLDKLAEAGVMEIRLFGGEFTVFKDWREIVEYAHKKGFFISFVSNGYLLDQQAVDTLSRCGVTQCTISVHGPEEVHDSVVKKVGSFEQAMRAVKRLEQAGIEVTIAYTPNASNLNELKLFIHHLYHDYNIHSFSISRLFSDDRYEHLTLLNYHHLLAVIDQCHQELGVAILLADSFPRCRVPMKYWHYLGYCSQGVGFAQIDFNGNLKHCSATSHTIGNVLTDDIINLWDNQLVEMRNLDHLPKSCKICPIFCGGGCTVSRGVANKFAPDEFIPWPNDENWLQAIFKALYNRVRKIAHGFAYPKAYTKTELPNKVPECPTIHGRYKVRVENGEFLVMFEKGGVKFLSTLAHEILLQINGKRNIEQITAKVKGRHSQATKETVLAIVKGFPVK